MTEHEATPGIEDRRSLLKKAAVVGGAAWVAPVVLSRSVAAAGSAPPCAGVQPTLGNPAGVPCGSVTLQNPAPTVWVLNTSPNGPFPPPNIANVVVTGATVTNTVGLGSPAVTIQVSDPNVVPQFCVTVAC